MDILPEYGPEYPRELSPTVAKWRRNTRHGLADFTKAERREYGEAVGAAIRQKQRQELRGAAETMPAAHCASGTWHTTGKAIHKAIRARQMASLLAYPAKVRRDRSEVEWKAMYKAAMKAKRASEPVQVEKIAA